MLRRAWQWPEALTTLCHWQGHMYSVFTYFLRWCRILSIHGMCCRIDGGNRQWPQPRFTWHRLRQNITCPRSGHEVVRSFLAVVETASWLVPKKHVTECVQQIWGIGKIHLREASQKTTESAQCSAQIQNYFHQCSRLSSFAGLSLNKNQTLSLTLGTQISHLPRQRNATLSWLDPFL